MFDEKEREAFRKRAKETLQHVAEHKEEYIKAFVAKTGLQPDECRLVHQQQPFGAVKIWAEPFDRKNEQEMVRVGTKCADLVRDLTEVLEKHDLGYLLERGEENEAKRNNHTDSSNK